MFEILTPEQYPELDAFVERHPLGGFTQISAWRHVKTEWDYAAIACRDGGGRMTGAMSVLIRTLPPSGTAMLYAPRGPVCDPHDLQTLQSLKQGVDILAAKRRAHVFVMDPDLPMSDNVFIGNVKSLGFKHRYGPDGFEGVQARFNYRLYLEGRDEEALFANLTQGARRKVRIAMKRGVDIKVEDAEHLGDFERIMRVTGERDGFSTRPRGYFERFLSALGGRARLYMGYCEGVPVCGAIAVNCAGKCSYVYGASDNLYRDAMPNYLIQWEMIRWAVETGCTVYDFQGVSGNLTPEGNPKFGLYQFKKGFNGQLDELAGEFHYVYRPLANAVVDAAVAANDKIRNFGRHRRKPETTGGAEGAD